MAFTRTLFYATCVVVCAVCSAEESYYDVLGVRKDVDAAALKKAYRCVSTHVNATDFYTCCWGC